MPRKDVENWGHKVLVHGLVFVWPTDAESTQSTHPAVACLWRLQSYSAIKKTDIGPLAGFLSVFLAVRGGHASFLMLSSGSLPPSHDPSRRARHIYGSTARGTTAKRQKWGRFLLHQRANVAPPALEQLRPRE